jgi:ligand-binding sensor domain-containing protein
MEHETKQRPVRLPNTKQSIACALANKEPYSYIRSKRFLPFMKRCSLLAFLFFFGKLFSQSYNFKNYSVEDGLHYIHIADIFQDKKGYLWTGGYGGLSRFDGNRFVNYSPRNGLVHYQVQAITQNVKGDIIVGTIEGLSIFDGKEFRNYTRANGLSNEVVNSVAVMGSRVAVATEGGLFYLENRKISNEPRLPGEAIKKIKSKGSGFIGITPKEVFTKMGDKFVVNFSFRENSDTTLTSFESDENNTLWLGTNKGLFKVTDNNGKKNLEVIVPQKEITCVYADKKNSIWIGTREQVYNYTGKLKEYILSKESIANDILSITSDYEQNIWIGTHSGLFKFRDEGFVSYGLEDGLKSAMIYPVLCDKNNTIWFGTERGGMYSFNGISFTNYSQENGLPGRTVRGLVIDSLNRLWIATENGLCIKQGSAFKPVSKLNNARVQTLYLDKQNRLWMGLRDGIIVMENLYGESPRMRFMKLPVPVQATDHLVTAFRGDEEGNVWIASFISGLYLYNGSEIVSVNKQYHLQTNSVSDIVLSKNKRLYIGTLDGIYIVNPASGVTERIREEDGLNSNLVYSVFLTDNEKTLWAGTNQGACKIDLESYFTKHERKILSFGKTEGFKGVECNTGGLCRDTNGTIWFGTVSGIMKYSAGKYLENTEEAKLSMTNIKLFYDDTALEQKAVLPNSLNNITFQYTGICLTNPEKVRYIHRLEGFEKNWSPESDQGFVTYSNLPPGRYTFKVRCCNNNGIWTSTPLFFEFTVTPPLWQRWWFILSELLFIGLVIGVIFRIRLNQLKKEQQRETRTQIEIAKNELKALRAQMNPHFLFNSLNSIQQFILNHHEDEAVFYLNRFARLMRMILNYSEKQTITLKEEIDALKIYIDLEKMRFSNKFDYEIKIDEHIDSEYEQIPTMLLQPFIENAILHGLTPSDKQGFLKIHFYQRDNFMHAMVEDNGIGRVRSAEMNRDSHKSHTSMGMKITRERLKLLESTQQTTYKAQITDLYDQNGKPCGTRVEITWPIL